MLDLKLTGKRALVTGSSSGIGEAIVRALAGQGVHVVVHGRNPERAQRVADEIRRDGGKAWVALGDLGQPDTARAVAKNALEALGGSVDILVNNAGGADGGMNGWFETDPEQWHATFEQNLYSSVRLVRELVPGMKRSGWGRIIQIASGVATQPFPIGPDYAASKAALVNATVSLAKALGGSGITVNTVSPGPIATPAAERVFREVAKERNWGDDWAQIERLAVENFVPTPLGRMGTSEEVAVAVAFLASPVASYIHGANLRVDGGYVTTIN
jgi:3-oxoacyl-[acyl-carrier protein] reductase